MILDKIYVILFVLLFIILLVFFILSLYNLSKINKKLVKNHANNRIREENILAINNNLSIIYSKLNPIARYLKMLGDKKIFKELKNNYDNEIQKTSLILLKEIFKIENILEINDAEKLILSEAEFLFRRKKKQNNEKEKKIIEDLIYYMEVKKMFLNKDLTIKIMATKLNISSTYLSNLINKELQSNFSNFINKYRINYSCDLFIKSKDKDIPIERIALLSGFSRRTYFSNLFKAEIGVTPSFYKKELLEKNY